MKTRVILIVILAILLIVFVLQNSTPVNVRFWFWDVELPRALLLFVCFAMGLVVGLLIPSTKKGEKEKPKL